MKILAGLTRLFETSSASDRAICEAYTHNSQLQLEANDLGHCAVYEKELQRVWPITEENRKAKIGEFPKKHGFRLAYTSRGTARSSYKTPPDATSELAKIAAVRMHLNKISAIVVNANHGHHVTGCDASRSRLHY